MAIELLGLFYSYVRCDTVVWCINHPSRTQQSLIRTVEVTIGHC